MVPKFSLINIGFNMPCTTNAISRAVIYLLDNTVAGMGVAVGCGFANTGRCGGIGGGGDIIIIMGGGGDCHAIVEGKGTAMTGMTGG